MLLFNVVQGLCKCRLLPQNGQQNIFYKHFLNLCQGGMPSLGLSKAKMKRNFCFPLTRSKTNLYILGPKIVLIHFLKIFSLKNLFYSPYDFMKMKTLTLQPKLLISWNWTHKNTPDWQHTCRSPFFEICKKVLYHSTLLQSHTGQCA